MASDPDSLRAASADLLLGSACVGCDRPGLALCRRCQSPLEQLPLQVRPRPCPDGLPAVWAVADYDGPVRLALIAHKEEARLSLAKPLGRALAVSVMGLLSQTPRPGRVMLVPIPSHRAIVRERGHDPLASLTAVCRRSLRAGGIGAGVSGGLRRAKAVEDQAGLTEQERRVNLDHAFAVRGRRPSGPLTVVIVDDIITTGSTLAEAARALSSSGLDVAGAAVVAATKRRHVRS